ncbi:uncharacterized protein LOC120139077 isoform X3 [Hibiscus syriacus]|uniref:uncharacterized protein LOC120139077 isoform X3 n=1 Tax=Hibiscus syriacus TaxID=106335 RepID=UPI001924C3DB|nr:uncharacterized protein LOC120139077 isoform X3 [Hibiscus syriacus]
MLENPTSTAPDAAPLIKRYAPPNQRNRSLGRHKSGDWFHWTNNVYGNDSEKNLGAASRNNNLVGDAGSSAILNEDLHRPILIPLEGCSRSDASRLLSYRTVGQLPYIATMILLLICLKDQFCTLEVVIQPGGISDFPIR